MRFRSKLTICITALLSIIFSVGGTLLIILTFQGNLRREQEQSLQNYRSLCSTLIIANSISEQKEIQDFVDILRSFNDESSDWEALRLYDSGGVLYESLSGFAFDQTLHAEVDETKCAMKILNTGSGQYQQLTGSFYIGDELVWLDAAKDISELYDQRDTQIRIYKTLFIVIVLFGALLSFLTSYFLTGSLKKLSYVSRKIADGDLSMRVKIKSNDEMGRLADDFNKMADSLTGKLNELEESMRRQERFMGSFAHELKTPMTSMIGYADLIRSCELTREEQLRCAEYIFSEGKRLESLSFKLLDLLVLKKQDFELVRANPAKLLNDTAQTMLGRLYSFDVLLKVDTETGHCMLEPDLVKSLLLNVIDNSVKSMEKGGSVHAVQTMLEDGCRFVISDNGRGIPEEELDKISEAFYRVDKSRSRKQGGAGLGLSLCNEIVKLHNGSMRFESRPNEGTTVIIELRSGIK